MKNNVSNHSFVANLIKNFDEITWVLKFFQVDIDVLLHYVVKVPSVDFEAKDI